MCGAGWVEENQGAPLTVYLKSEEYHRLGFCDHGAGGPNHGACGCGAGACGYGVGACGCDPATWLDEDEAIV